MLILSFNCRFLSANCYFVYKKNPSINQDRLFSYDEHFRYDSKHDRNGS